VQERDLWRGLGRPSVARARFRGRVGAVRPGLVRPARTGLV